MVVIWRNPSKRREGVTTIAEALVVCLHPFRCQNVLFASLTASLQFFIWNNHTPVPPPPVNVLCGEEVGLGIEEEKEEEEEGHDDIRDLSPPGYPSCINNHVL